MFYVMLCYAGPGDTAAIWLLVRRLQKVLSRHESLEVPYQLGGAAALALGVDRGMRLLLEPHRNDFFCVVLKSLLFFIGVCAD